MEGRYDALRPRYLPMDRATQEREIRKLVAAPDFMLGSVQAITEDGALVVVSYSASQIGPYASGAGRVILVVGSQRSWPISTRGCAEPASMSCRTRTPPFGIGSAFRRSWRSSSSSSRNRDPAE